MKTTPASAVRSHQRSAMLAAAGGTSGLEALTAMGSEYDAMLASLAA